MPTADQVGDGAEVDELAHLQVVEPARGCDHNVHAALHLADLASPVPSPVDAHTEQRRRRDNHNCGSQLFQEASAPNGAGLNLV